MSRHHQHQHQQLSASSVPLTLDLTQPLSLTSPEADVPSIQCNRSSNPRSASKPCAPACPLHSPASIFSAAGRPARSKYAFQSPLSLPLPPVLAVEEDVAERWGGAAGAPWSTNATAVSRKPAKAAYVRSAPHMRHAHVVRGGFVEKESSSAGLWSFTVPSAYVVPVCRSFRATTSLRSAATRCITLAAFSFPTSVKYKCR